LLNQSSTEIVLIRKNDERKLEIDDSWEMTVVVPTRAVGFLHSWAKMKGATA
jgi:hypothetical protein